MRSLFRYAAFWFVLRFNRAKICTVPLDRCLFIIFMVTNNKNNFVHCIHWKKCIFVIYYVLIIERRVIMPISYEKLFLLMKERGLTSYKIRKENIISQGALTSLRSGKSVTMDTIEKLCKALNCQVGDIVEYVPDDEAKK